MLVKWHGLMANYGQSANLETVLVHNVVGNLQFKAASAGSANVTLALFVFGQRSKGVSVVEGSPLISSQESRREQCNL